MMRPLNLSICMFVGLAQLAVSRDALACPFCPPAQQTLKEIFEESDVVMLAQWAKAKPASEEEQGNTTFSITEVAKGESDEFKKGGEHVFGRFRDGKVGDLFLLSGVKSKQGDMEWDLPVEITETGYQYVIQAPNGESSAKVRLSYYLKFLEYPDPMIAMDAYMEFAKAPYGDVAQITEKISAKKLREWISSNEVNVVGRRGLYGMMLGLCGRPEDITFLRELVVKETEDLRIGIDGVMGGYLLLAREEALADIVRTKFKVTENSSETFAAMQAIRFMWQYGQDRISGDSLKKAMQSLLKHPKYAELVITDLARWKDWALQDHLMKLFDRDGYNDRYTRRAIIGFMIAATKDVPDDAKAKTPPHATKAAKNIAALREQHPRLVREAERIFFE